MEMPIVVLTTIWELSFISNGHFKSVPPLRVISALLKHYNLSLSAVVEAAEL